MPTQYHNQTVYLLSIRKSSENVRRAKSFTLDSVRYVRVPSKYKALFVCSMQWIFRLDQIVEKAPN